MPGPTSVSCCASALPSAPTTSAMTASITSGEALPRRATTRRATCWTTCGATWPAPRSMRTLRRRASSSASGVTIASASTVSVDPSATWATSACDTTRDTARSLARPARRDQRLGALLAPHAQHAHVDLHPALVDPPGGIVVLGELLVGLAEAA